MTLNATSTGARRLVRKALAYRPIVRAGSAAPAVVRLRRRAARRPSPPADPAFALGIAIAQDGWPVVRRTEQKRHHAGSSRHGRGAGAPRRGLQQAGRAARARPHAPRGDHGAGLERHPPEPVRARLVRHALHRPARRARVGRGAPAVRPARHRDRPHVDRPHRSDRRVAARAADRLARARGRAVLPGDRGQPAGRRAPPAHHHRGAPRRRAVATRCSTPTSSTRTPSTPAATPRCSPPSAPRAPGAWATSSRRSRPSRTASSAPTAKGALVVQGGPGTGKTAVALHRAAYLLYTHRDRLAQSGVLVLGPTRVVPAVHRGRAAVARRDRRGAVLDRRAHPGHRADGAGPRPRRDGEGRRRHGGCARQRGAGAAARAPAGRHDARGRHRGAPVGRHDRDLGPRGASRQRHAQRRARRLPHPPARPGRHAACASPQARRRRRVRARGPARGAARDQGRAPRAQPALDAAHAAARPARPLRQARGPRRGCGRPAHPRPAAAAAPRPRRRVHDRRRAAARRARRAARRRRRGRAPPIARARPRPRPAPRRTPRASSTPRRASTTAASTPSRAWSPEPTSPHGSPTAARPSRWPSARRPTASGRTATWWSTRRRSSRRWPGARSRGAARRAR